MGSEKRRLNRPLLRFSEAGWKEKGKLIWDAVVLQGKRAKNCSELGVIWKKAVNTLQTFTANSKTAILATEKTFPCLSGSKTSLSEPKEMKKLSKIMRFFGLHSVHSAHSESEDVAPFCSSHAIQGQEMPSPAPKQNESNQEVPQLPDPRGVVIDEKAGGAEGGAGRAQVMQQGGGSQGSAGSKAVLESSSQEKELTSSHVITTEMAAPMSAPEKPDPARLKASAPLQSASTKSITLSVLFDTGVSNPTINQLHWPTDWCLRSPYPPSVSAEPVSIVFEDKQSIVTRPYVMPVPRELPGLLGRDGQNI
ncbi:microfibrillar-associated protein 3-like isoform X2 [Prinia subflava]|uniref:microfibrillar-associated protein 3-like isoform X2 n=1 Tax=Prinia subflava TaxID=208062 RepID=UPI002FE1B8B8